MKSKTLLITPFHVMENCRVIHNGFSYVQNLFPDKTNVFFPIGHTNFEMLKQERFVWNNYHVERTKRAFAQYDRVFVTINHAQLVDYFRPLMDSRWVLGGAFFESFRSTFDYYDCPATIWNDTIESYLGVPLQTRFKDYFHKAFWGEYWTQYTCSLGAGCLFKKCTFCTEKNIPYRERGSIRENLLSLKKYERESFIYTAISSPTPSQLQEILYVKNCCKADKIFAYMRADESILHTITQFDDLKKMAFLVGVEAFAQSGIDKFEKNFSLDVAMELAAGTVSRGGMMVITIQRNPYLTSDTLQLYKENFDKFRKLVPPSPLIEICFARPETIWYGEENCTYPNKKRIILDSFFQFMNSLEMFTEDIPLNIAKNNVEFQEYVKECGYTVRYVAGMYKNRPWGERG